MDWRTIGGWGTIKKETVEMFNRQLRKNIKSLDAQIGELSRELEGLKKDTKYDVKMRTLSDLVELRSKLVRKDGDEKSDVVIELDRQIEELARMIEYLESDEVYTAKLHKLDELTKVRCQLSESKTKESNIPVILSGVVSISSILIVLKHEEANVITSKAFGMIPKMFRGK
jgi:predicted RNase H-like nuclease (RuvC/YqgF family)